MQQLSNDTGSWSLIDIPLPVPFFYNSNTYDSLSNGGATLNGFNNPIIPISIDSLSSLAPPGTIETNSFNYWAFTLIFFPLFTIFGNVLVVVSVYREKSLHTVTNYFVVSLAISDITVAAVVMPFAIYLEVSNKIFFNRFTST
jgi:dopamine D2-like receptor